MLIDYDPSLVEHAVFEASRRDAKLEAELHRAIDPLYELRDDRKRNARFSAVYLRFFRRLHLDHVVSSLLAERPLLERFVRQCIVREVLSRKKESAELFVKKVERGTDSGSNGHIRTIVIQACAMSLVDPTRFLLTMRRELLQITDMIDHCFEYRKESLVGGRPRQNLVRDRYRVLWDLYAQGRLLRQGHRDDDAVRRLTAQFKRVFATESSRLVCPALKRVLEAERITHGRMLCWASTPEQLFEAEGSSRSRHQPASGEPCPVCECSTYDWSDLEESDGKIICAVQRDFPQWQPSHGLCRQCADVYASVNRCGDPNPGSTLRINSS